MCGISGELRFDGKAPEQACLQRMMQKLERRGPDSAGHLIQGPVGLGHRRLSIIDLSARANQPMVDEALKLSLVFNGTIYNYPELREELLGKGYQFFSHGDTEVILKAYAEWGEQCVERLHGMFAFALWDQVRRQQLFLARDRLVSSRCITASQPAACVSHQPVRPCWRAAMWIRRWIRLPCIIT